MAKMRVVQVARAKGPLELVEREIPDPDPGTVRIRVEACGVCHSDSFTKEGLFPGIQYPRVPGHEVIGHIDAIGANVRGWSAGQRVGVGWHGGNCGYCNACRSGDAFACETEALVTGVTSDGGYADYMIAPSSALARVPDELSSVEAAPLMCAGITTFNALRNSGARPGETVAVLGLGGLGHLGTQFAAKLGFKTVAIARGPDKELLARQLGAHHYIDNAAEDPAAALQKLGGAKAILATVTSAEAMNSVQAGLAVNGTLMVIGVVDSLAANPLLLITGRRSIKGWYAGTSIDSQQTLAFSALTGVRSMNEIFALERAAEGYEHMMSGSARFRVVLTTGELIQPAAAIMFGPEEEQLMSGNPAQLYEKDFVRWTEQQAAALRDAAGQSTNLPLDWENLAEEIDSLGRSHRRELRSRIAVIIEHLIKLECSPAVDPRRGWMETIGRQRSDIELLLDDSPSLKGEVAGIVAGEAARMARHLVRSLRRHGEATPDVIGKITAANYTEDQVLGDWFPGDAPDRNPLPANGERE